MMSFDEKTEALLIGGLKVVQSEAGYRHAIDPFLLSAFAQVKSGERVADLGAAAGIIPLLLSVMTQAEKIVGFEIQSALVEKARQNVALNDLQERIELIEADIRDIASRKILAHESFDVVVSNPPYRKLSTGKVAPGEERAACRHELHGDIGDFVEAAFYLLRNSGRMFLVYLPERLPELLRVMNENKIEPKRLRCVHSREDSDAVMVLVEGRKNGKPGMQVEKPLYIYCGEEYSREVKDIFQIS